MDKETLILVGEWAKSRVASGEEPPWTFHKLKQLADITKDLAEGFDAATVYEPSAPAQLPENVLQFEKFRSGSPKPDVSLPV